MSIEALQDYTYITKYARYDKAAGRRETFEEANDRVLAMHLKRYPQIEAELRWAFDRVKERRVLGSQRALQFGGAGIERCHARLLNCWSSYCDRPRFFQECFWVLLAGGGVGFSVQQHHVNRLPDIRPTPRHFTHVFTVPDTIEGWADSLGMLLSDYFGYGRTEFDFSQVRPAGSPLSTSSGKAPGPEPLRLALEAARAVLDKAAQRGKRLRPIDCYDIVMHASDAVLAGGVRRSATICIFSPADEEMLNAKTGNWFWENPQRGRSNNSVLLLRNKTSWEQFLDIYGRIRQWGEPGFYWSDSTEQIPNPCVEIGFWPVDEQTGMTGFSPCNLCEINGKLCKTPEDFRIAAKAAAIIGTAQAGYTDFPYLGEVTERIVRREALLGVSITGMMDNPTILFNKDLQREVSGLVKAINAEIADKIGIRHAARTTCIKPSGSASCVLGTASGIHPHHAKRYIRRVQTNKMDPALAYFQSINPRAVEDSVWSKSKTDSVVSFCVEVGPESQVKNDLDALYLLKAVKETQENWVEGGKRLSHCTQPWLSNNVSNTITVQPDEWDAVAKYIYENRQSFAGISLLPASGDKDYQQAPFTRVLTAEEIVAEYGAAGVFASGLIVDGLAAFDGNLWTACDAALGVIKLDIPINTPSIDKIEEWFMSQYVPPLEEVFSREEIDAYWEYMKVRHTILPQRDWTRRAVQFADRYFSGDIRKMTYCLKDVSNLHLWHNLQREYKPVDWTAFHEETDTTTPLAEAACAGGGCEVRFN